MTASQELLAEYTRTGSDAAFRELVTRYVDLVYSTAVRLVGSDTHLAEDVAQSVFLNLARKAHTFPKDMMLGGWLHRNTCFVAAGILRRERRRHSRERQAVEMNILQDDSQTNLSLVAPILDEAINELADADRTAILLRFYEQLDFRSVGEAMGSNEDAARMRVSRTLEKLEKLLKRRGITTTASALSVILSASAIQAAPAGLAVTISAALAGTTIATTATATVTKAITMTTMKKTLFGTALAACVATPLTIQHQNHVRLRAENRVLRQQLDQLGQKQTESARSSILAMPTETAVTLTEDQFSELMRLRGEVGLLRQQTGELEALRKEKEQLRASLAARAIPGQVAQPGPPKPSEVAAAKAVIFNPAADVAEKLTALRTLRSANDRGDDVVKQMVQAYYSTDNPKWRADIFRQLNGITTPELKRPLLEAVSEPTHPPELRAEAAETLGGYLPDPDAKAWLEHLAANDAHKEVREEASHSLEASRRPRAQ